MKYTNEIIINLPLDEVIQKLDNAENMKHWQRGLVGYEQVSGTPGEEGAKMKLKYVTKKREMELEETIIKRNFPDEFHASYNTKGVHNIQENFFEKVDANTTKWTSKSEFQFSSFPLKVFGFLMPGMFKKQSLKFLVDFKNFAEQGTSVNDA